MRTNMAGAAPERLTAKGRATRERIVAAASALMFENGVRATTIEDVLRAAGGVSPSQVYHYFGGKSGLVKAVVAHQTECVLGVQVPMLSRIDSIEALEAWRDAMVALQRERAFAGGCPMGSLVCELAEGDPDARTDLADGFARWQTAILDGLHAMRDRGDLSQDADPDRLALALLAALQGGLLMTQARRDSAALEAVLDTVLDRIRRHATR